MSPPWGGFIASMASRSRARSLSEPMRFEIPTCSTVGSWLGKAGELDLDQLILQSIHVVQQFGLIFEGEVRVTQKGTSRPLILPRTSFRRAQGSTEKKAQYYKNCKS
jgi:hypothetical protein